MSRAKELLEETVELLEKGSSGKNRGHQNCL